MNGNFKLISTAVLVLGLNLSAQGQSCLCQNYPKLQNQNEETITPSSSAAPLKLGGFQAVDVFNTNKTQVLSPLASVAQTTIDIQALPVDVKLKGLQGITIKVRNNTDRPVYFRGDEAAATIDGARISAAQMPEIEDLIPTRDNPKGYGLRSVVATISAAVTVGAVQTVEDQVTENGPMAGRYGWDNARRIDRQTRFAKRVLWPGDSSEGVIYLKTNKALSGAVVELGVSAYYDASDRAILRCAIK